MCPRWRRGHERQIEQAMDTLAEGPEEFYKSYLDRREVASRGPKAQAPAPGHPYAALPIGRSDSST
jgi:hypothetical protein